MRLKIVVLAPIPSASDQDDHTGKPGVLAKLTKGETKIVVHNRFRDDQVQCFHGD